jgi:hypothetical protein
MLGQSHVSFGPSPDGPHRRGSFNQWPDFKSRVAGSGQYLAGRLVRRRCQPSRATASAITPGTGTGTGTRDDNRRASLSEKRHAFPRGGASVTSRCDSATVRQGRAYFRAKFPVDHIGTSLQFLLEGCSRWTMACLMRQFGSLRQDATARAFACDCVRDT